METRHAAHAQRRRAVEGQAAADAGLGCRVVPRAHCLTLALVQLMVEHAVLWHEQRLALERAHCTPTHVHMLYLVPELSPRMLPPCDNSMHTATSCSEAKSTTLAHKCFQQATSTSSWSYHSVCYSNTSSLSYNSLQRIHGGTIRPISYRKKNEVLHSTAMAYGYSLSQFAGLTWYLLNSKQSKQIKAKKRSQDQMMFSRYRGNNITNTNSLINTSYALFLQ